MIDTVILHTPPCLDSTLDKILIEYMNISSNVNCSNGVINYEFTSGELLGSYDYRIRIQIRDYEWFKGEYDKIPKKIIVPRFLRIELSLHKFLYTQNAFGSDDDLLKQLTVLYCDLTQRVGILPPLTDWTLKQIDIANCFEMPSNEEIDLYISRLSKLSFPRRQNPIIYSNSIMWSGSTSTIKFYNKYAEFKKHDRKRLVKFVEHSEHINYNRRVLKDMESIISKLLRIEVSIKDRKLDNIKVGQVDMNVIISYYWSELDKILKLGSENMISKNHDVYEKLVKNFKKIKAKNLYTTYLFLSVNGEPFARLNINDRTLRDHLKCLKESNITWLNTDIEIKTNIKLFVPNQQTVFLHEPLYFIS